MKAINFLFNNKHLLISCLSGIIVALSLAGYNISFLAWVGFIPFFIVLFVEKSFKKAILYSFCFGFFYNALGLRWFLGLFPLYWLGLNTITGLILVIFILIAISMFQSAFIALFGLLSWLTNKANYIKVLLVPFIWVICNDYLMSIGPFAFPWNLIQYSQYKNLSLIQVCSFIGGTGLAYLIILFNCLITFIILEIAYFKKYIYYMPEKLNIQKNNRDKYPHIRLIFNTFIFIIMLSLLILINIYGFKNLSNDYKGNINASIVQAGFPIEYYKTGKISNYKELSIYLNLIRNCPSGLIILPEGGISGKLRDNSNSLLLFPLKMIAHIKNSTIITGTEDYLDNQSTNAAIAINPGIPETSKIPVYNKIHLVPYGEYTPFRKYLPVFIENIMSISSKYDFANGKKHNLLPTPYGNVGALICFEAVLPNMSRKLVNNGANILVNISNLGWFHNSIIDDQFIAICVIRAVENGRFFIVAINNGPSVIITPTGKIICQSKKNIPVFVSAKISCKDNITFFTKWGI